MLEILERGRAALLYIWIRNTGAWNEDVIAYNLFFNAATLGVSDVSTGSMLLSGNKLSEARGFFEVGEGIGTGRSKGDAAGDTAAGFKPREGGGGGGRFAGVCRSDEDDDERRACTSRVGEPENVFDVARGRGLCAPATVKRSPLALLDFRGSLVFASCSNLDLRLFTAGRDSELISEGFIVKGQP